MTNNQNNESTYPIIDDEYMDQVLKVGPRDVTLSGAEHYKIDPKTGRGIPSDDSVDEMRDWSILNEK